MDPRRKKIYIIIIVVCLVFSVGLLAWSFLGNSAPPPQVVQSGPSGVASHPVVQTPVFDGSDFLDGFPAPSVFPNTNSFDTSVLDSTAFKGLVEYTPVDIQGQLGRDNPFKGY